MKPNNLELGCIVKNLQYPKPTFRATATSTPKICKESIEFQKSIEQLEFRTQCQEKLIELSRNSSINNKRIKGNFEIELSDAEEVSCKFLDGPAAPLFYLKSFTETLRSIIIGFKRKDFPNISSNLKFKVSVWK